MTTIIGLSPDRAYSPDVWLEAARHQAGVNERGPEIGGDFRASETCG
jgi:hypothetical protein